MNGWAMDLLPAVWWLRIYILSAIIAGIGLLYILEQIVIYGNQHFCHIVTALYRLALIVMLIGLFADVVSRLAKHQPPMPSIVLLVTGVSILVVLIGVTHDRRRDFGA